jgi:Epoxide hydrolase N terminus
MTRPRAHRLAADRFAIDVDERELHDLKGRIDATRWPPAAPGSPWEQGTDLTYLRELLRYWAEEFDWHAQKRELNGFDHYRAEIDGVRIHFVHERARRGEGIPLILTHGWPSNFVEYLPLVPLLTDPAAHEIDGPAFDLVIPSLPGYGFSERPSHPVTYRDVESMCTGLAMYIGTSAPIRRGAMWTRNRVQFRLRR